MALIRVVLLAVLCAVFTSMPVLALPSSVRVKLFEWHGGITSVQIRGPLEISAPRRQRFTNEGLSVAVDGGRLKVGVLGNSGKSIRPLLNCSRLILEARDRRGVRIKLRPDLNRAYRGRLTFAVDSSSLVIVNEVPTRDYIASVVGSEAPPRCPEEALKAFAVLTTGIVERKKDNELVGDSTREQAFKGCEQATPAVLRAVQSAFGKRVLYRKSPIRIYYHSTCAGGTSSGAAIFGDHAKPLAYLQSVKCVYCKQSPFWRTKTSSVPVKTLEKIFDGRLPTISSYDEAKRPAIVQVNDKETLSGYEAWLKIGRSLGWGIVPGTRYQFKKASNEIMQLQSSGAGHGVGLCQWGAVGLALRGKKCDEILKFYFPGCEVR